MKLTSEQIFSEYNSALSFKEAIGSKGISEQNKINEPANETNTYYSRESISNISEDLGYDFTFSSNENFIVCIAFLIVAVTAGSASIAKFALPVKICACTSCALEKY